MTDAQGPSFAINGLLLPWPEDSPHQRLGEGVELSAADWPLIEEALELAGYVVVPIAPAPTAATPSRPLSPSSSAQSERIDA